MTITTNFRGARAAQLVLGALLLCSLLGAKMATAQSGNVGLQSGASKLQDQPVAETLGTPFMPTERLQFTPYEAFAPQPAPMPMSGGWQTKPLGGRNYWGFELGATFNWFQGASQFAYTLSESAANSPTGVQIDQAVKFASPGSGVGFLFGGVVDFALSNAFSLEGKLRYVKSTVTGDDTRTNALVSPPGQSARIVSHHSTGISYFGLDALGRIQLSPNSVYLLAGLGFSTLVGNSLDLTKRIDSAGPGTSFVDDNGTTTGLTSLSSTGSLSSGYNSSRFALKFGVGTFIPIGSAWTVLTPEILADIPLTELYDAPTVSAYSSNGGTAPKLWHIDFSVGIKFPWGGNSSSDVMDSHATPQDNGERNSDNMVNLKGHVKDKSGHPVDANMTVVDLSNNEVVSTGRTDNGDYSLPVKAPGKYSVTADADGYLFGSTYFEVDDNGRILSGNHDISLATAAEGRMRLLVFFDFNKDYLQPASYPELDRAIRLMKANPSMEVEIAGYTDSKGAPAYNLDLSNRRASSVRSYLIKNGIDADRVTAHGYGMQDPIATNDTEEGRASNRRVEFVVTKK